MKRLTLSLILLVATAQVVSAQAIVVPARTGGGGGGTITGGDCSPQFVQSINSSGVPTCVAAASAALDGLASVNINTSLLAQTGVDLGSAAKPFRDLFLWGSGTYGTTSFRITGTPTAARVWTIPNVTDTFAGLAATQAFTNKTYEGATFSVTGTPTVTFGSGGTVVYTTGTQTLAGKTLTTPVLGVATATSINGLTITTSTGTLTVPNGVTFTGPGASGTAAILGANTFTGRQDATGAASTAPMKSGTAPPGTCTVGDEFFDTDATAGSNLYGCTATNTWTLQAGGGGGSMVYPGAGVPLSTGSSWGTSFTAPAIAIAGTTDVQTLTNKTLTTPTIGSFTNATHDHTNAAGGGVLGAAAFPTSITETDITTGVTISVYGGSYAFKCASACTAELPTAVSKKGETIAFCVSEGSAPATLDGNSSQTINGLTTRIMVEGECANLVVRETSRTDATLEWKKISGHSVAMTSTAVLAGAGPAALTAATVTTVALDTNESGQALMWDSGNSRLRTIRPGLYRFSLSGLFSSATSGDYLQMNNLINGSTITAVSSTTSNAASTFTWISFSSIDTTLAAGDYVQLQVYSTLGGVFFNGGSNARMSLTEISPW